jgi:hypothetical protein
LVEVVELAFVESEGAADGAGDGFGDVDVSALFEPGVPGGADAGEDGDFFAS